MISVFAQIVQRLPGHLIEKLARGQKVKAREFSYSAQLYTLMLGQFLHAFSLNELVDISEVHKAELSRIRGICPAKRNTFSYANRNRDPKVAQDFYWALRDWFDRRSPGFRSLHNRGALARFKARHVYAVDASLIPLSLCCIDWALRLLRDQQANINYIAAKEELAEIDDIIRDPRCFMGQRMPRLKELTAQLNGLIAAAVADERKRAVEKIDEMRQNFLALPDFSAVSQADQQRLTAEFDQAAESLKKQSLIAMIRDQLRAFEDTVKHLGDLIIAGKDR